MTTDHNDPVNDPVPALQDEFWGDHTDWSAETRRPSPASTRRSSSASGTIGRLWGALVGSSTRTERSHGSPDRSDETWPSEPPIDEVDDADAAWDMEPRPQPARGPGVDPLLARFGALAVIVTLAVPVVLGFTSDSDPQMVRTEGGAAATADQPVAPAPPPAKAPTGTAAAAVPSATPADDAPAAEQAAAPAAAPLAATTEDTATPTTSAPCGQRYELAGGDYWIRIADAADVTLADLLDVNDASIGTVLVPGRSICLPVGASTPAPPTTAAPTTAPSPTPVNASRSAAADATPTTTRTTSPTTAPSTTSAPAPTTTVPARPAAVSTEQAVAIIRSVWPDDLEERAIEIAWRESKHRSNVNNWCCYGLFQVNWNAHRGWLGSLGITSASQLYDPTLNATAAYALYQRAGGFGPWGG